MKKFSLVLSLMLIACGSNSTNSNYGENQTKITENAGNTFSIVMPLSNEMSQSVSCHIDKECSSDVAQLVDIQIENNEMHFNFEAIGAGETTVGIECTGSITENHTYNITVE